MLCLGEFSDLTGKILSANSAANVKAKEISPPITQIPFDKLAMVASGKFGR